MSINFGVCFCFCNTFFFFSFVSYPFYGVQFHPEKNLYEWKRNSNIPHTANAIKAAQYFSNFFVTESRKNSNRFPGAAEEDRALIYKFPVTFTGHVVKTYQQCYLFTDDVHYPNLAEELNNHGDVNVIAT